MAVQPLSPATRLRLGEPLPHQLPDRTQVAPSAHCCFHLSAYGVLATVSRSCPPPQGTSLCFTHPSAAISSKIHRSLIRKKPPNLHVLSTPPAFILSQDQTLRKKLIEFTLAVSFVIFTFQGAYRFCATKGTIPLFFELRNPLFLGNFIHVQFNTNKYFSCCWLLFRSTISKTI